MRIHISKFALAVCLGISAPMAHAAPVLLAQGTLNGSSAGANADLSGLTGTLENGLAANILGGLGSGLAYAGGNTFLAVPDRGPNATSYNALVDDTSSYVARFHTVTMDLALNPGAGLPFTLTPTLQSTTLLSSPTALTYGTGAGLGNKIDGVTPIGSGAPSINTPGVNYFTGRSDNFDPTKNSGNPNNARLDPESIRVSRDLASVFISDEYGPYVYQFDRATGQRIRSFDLPANLYVMTLSPNGTSTPPGGVTNEVAANTSGRVANKGMEGLAITPDGKTLVGIMQAGLIQDTTGPKADSKLLRIVTIDIASGTTHEFGYRLHGGSGVSDIVAINDHQFLIDERDGKGLGDGTNTAVKQLYKIDLTGAQDITSLVGTDASAKAVASTKIVDLVTLLTDPLLGANKLTTAQIPSKIEGIAFGADVTFNGNQLHTLYVANDNDFVPGVAGPNKFFVVGVTDADLLGAFVPQEIAEPGSLALLGAGLAGLAAARRRRKTVG